MTSTIQTSITMSETLLRQVDSLAQQLGISQSDLCAVALEHFVRTHKRLSPSDTHRPINQGDLYWVQRDDASEAGTEIPHPYVIVQDDLFNHSRIDTVVACALTSNIQRVSDTPGNLLLDPGEANLPRQSVVEISKISTIYKAQLGGYIGSLSEHRVSQTLAGIRFLQKSHFSGR